MDVLDGDFPPMVWMFLNINKQTKKSTGSVRTSDRDPISVLHGFKVFSFNAES